MKIAMVASESNPLVKSGGLADVVYSLSKELVKKGEDVSIFIPYYKKIRLTKNPSVKHIGNFMINMSWRQQGAAIYQSVIDGIKFYLIQNESYFDRDNLYGYHDDGERFAFFTLLVKKFMNDQQMKFDVIHIHDWQVGMLPTLVREGEMFNPIFKDTKFVSTIHNEAFQGMLDRYFVNDFFGLSDYLYDSGKLRFKNMFSTLKAGIEYSDAITTVSPTHRNELLRSDMGLGLENVLNYKLDRYYGVLNGIDVDEFNPKTDKLIYKNFDYKNIAEGKLENKIQLLKDFGLKETDGPVFGIVSRLTWQKGIELILQITDKIISEGGSIVCLGSGEYQLEQAFENLRNRYPNNVGIYIGYSDDIAHKIYAGSDFLLMPSLFEPCGLSQMIALRYGTLPVVRNVGGLADTIVGYTDYNLELANGVSFNDFNFGGIDYAINQSFKIFRNREIFTTLRHKAIKEDHSWAKSADEYLNIYRKIIGE